MPSLRSRSAAYDSDDDDAVSVKADEWEVPRCNVHLGEKIGEGAFGVVMRAVVMNLGNGLPSPLMVAAKQCGRGANALDKRNFLDEMDVMKMFSAPWHDNVRAARRFACLLAIALLGAKMVVVVAFIPCPRCL